MGNGGLGRLAACFMESLSSLNCPAFGYGIRYEHGLFRQRFEGGQQVETPEDWLNQPHPWEFVRINYSYEIGFKGHVDQIDGRAVWHPSESVVARAYDTPVIGWGGDWANTLRLWGRIRRRCWTSSASTRAITRPRPNPRRWPARCRAFFIPTTPRSQARNCA